MECYNISKLIFSIWRGGCKRDFKPSSIGSEAEPSVYKKKKYSYYCNRPWRPMNL
jgi:hypothetical protein